MANETANGQSTEQAERAAQDELAAIHRDADGKRLSREVWAATLMRCGHSYRLGATEQMLWSLLNFDPTGKLWQEFANDARAYLAAGG